MKLLDRILRGTPAHPPLAAHPLDDPEPEPDGKCTATTSKGARCKLDAKADGKCGVFHH